MSSNQIRRTAASLGKGRRVEGGRRKEILAAATERFGREGYEHTRWADVAADVGVGPTALYHYFESKQHCLYVIMDDALTDVLARFTALTRDAGDPRQALAAVLRDGFDVTEREMLRNRLLAAERGLAASRRASSRVEERARQAARERMRLLELAWAGFLGDAMRAGAIPDADPRLLARAVLGLYTSIWQWYRPNGIHSLQRIADFFEDRALAMMGHGTDDLVRPRRVA